MDIKITVVIVTLLVLAIDIINFSVIQFNNSFISNCRVQSVPCNLLESSNYWIDNKLPSDGDDILIDFSKITQVVNKDQFSLNSLSLIYLLMGNTSYSFNSITLIGSGNDINKSGIIRDNNEIDSSGEMIIINLVLLDNVNLLLSKLNLSNSYLNLQNNNNSIGGGSIRVMDKLIVSNNSTLKVSNSGRLEIDGFLKIDESSYISFYNSSTVLLNGKSSFKSQPFFQDNSTLINSNDSLSTNYFYNGIKSNSNGISLLSNCEFYKSSIFINKVVINGVVNINSASDNDIGSSNNIEISSLVFYNDLDIIQQGKININNGTVLVLSGSFNEKNSLGSSESDLLNLNGGTLEIRNSDFTITNYSSTSSNKGSIYFIQTKLNVSNTVIGFNNSNINIGNMGSTLYIINSTLNQFYEDRYQVSNNSIISASNVTVNSIQLLYSKLIIEEESTFTILGDGSDTLTNSYSNNIINTKGNLIIISSNFKVPLINLIEKMESSFYLINSNIDGSINITSDNKFYPYGKSAISNNLSIINGGQIIVDNSLNNPQQLTVGGNLVLDSNSSLYYQENGNGGISNDNSLININGNLTINGKLMVNIKSWSNKVDKLLSSHSSLSDYKLKLIKLSKFSNVNGLFNNGIEILINGIPTTKETLRNNKIESYSISIESGYITLLISAKKLPKWYIHALVIGILFVIGIVAGLIYAIAFVNNTIKYYSLQRKERYQNLDIPLLNSSDQDQNNHQNDEDQQQKEKIPLKTSKSNINTNNIIVKNDHQDNV